MLPAIQLWPLLQISATRWIPVSFQSVAPVRTVHYLQRLVKIHLPSNPNLYPICPNICIPVRTGRQGIIPVRYVPYCGQCCGSGIRCLFKSRNQGFSYIFCLVIEGSRFGSGTGSGSIPLTNGSGSRRPKNIRIRRIRIRNTAYGHVTKD